MSSSPPGARDSIPPCLPRLAELGFRAHARDESVIFFCVEDAPREACGTRTGPDGSLTFHTRLSGTVLDVGPGEMRIDTGQHRVLVRHLLPSSIDLRELSANTLEIEIVQRYRGRGRATIDAELRDSRGRMLLWAHDGRMPADRESHGLALRLTVDASGTRRLAVGHEGGVSSIASPDFAPVRIGRAMHDLVVVRLGADDVSFVLLRR